MICVLAGPGCRADKHGEAREVVPELKLEGVTFRVWRGAELRSYGEAREATLRRDSSQLTARDLVAILPRDNPGAGAVASDPGLPVRVTAPQGEGVLQDRTFAASGGITLSRGDDVARTERARFAPSPAGGLVTGDQPVRLSGRGYTLTGSGFTIEPVTGDVDVRGPARLETSVAALPRPGTGPGGAR